MERLGEGRGTGEGQRIDVGHLGGREAPSYQEGRLHSQLAGGRVACRLSFCSYRPGLSQRLLEHRKVRDYCQGGGGRG